MERHAFHLFHPRFLAFLMCIVFLGALLPPPHVQAADTPRPVPAWGEAVVRHTPPPPGSAPQSEAILPDTADVAARLSLEKWMTTRNADQERIVTDMRDFLNRVIDGQIGEIRGVYAPKLFALPVLPQPETDDTFVSKQPGFATLFNGANSNGITGLLAHNYLAGRSFYNLGVGQDVLVVYGDSSLRFYRVTEIARYKKLEPANSTSDYLDLRTGEQLTFAQVYFKFYTGEHRVIFQTCLAGEGIPNWGLIFAVATPLQVHAPAFPREVPARSGPPRELTRARLAPARF
jgi:hypothetical protein